MRVVAAFLSNTLFNFVIGVLLARFLGPADYGRFALAVAAAVMIQTIAFDWARLAAARFYSERVRTEQPTLRATLDASLALLIVGLVASTAGLLLLGFRLPMSSDLALLAVGVAIANGIFDYTDGVRAGTLPRRPLHDAGHRKERAVHAVDGRRAPIGSARRAQR